MIAVIGPSALESEPVWYEWIHGYLHSKAIVPILRKGEYEEVRDALRELNTPEFFEKHPSEFVPEDLLDLQCPNFQDAGEDSYNKALSKLCESLKKPVVIGALDGGGELVDLPPCFVPRDEKLRELCGYVFADLTTDMVFKPEERVTAIHGRGGSGKSVLAKKFIHSVKARHVFKHGIIWRRIGPDGDMLSSARSFVSFFTEDQDSKLLELETDCEKAKGLLKKILKNKKCLIVLDDIWDQGHIEYFCGALGKDCRLVFTTRDHDFVTRLHMKGVSVDEVSDGQAISLLAGRSGKKVTEMPEEAKEVARKCDNLPLALAICGAIMSVGGNTWAELSDALSEASESILKSQLGDYKNMEIDGSMEKVVNVFSPLKVSLDFLEKLDKEEENKEACLERRKHYLETAVFGSEISTPETVVLALWLQRDGMDKKHMRPLVGMLIGRALLKLESQENTPPDRLVSLHNLQQVYLADILHRENEEKLNELHRDVGQALLQWWQTKEIGQLIQTDEKQTREYVMDHLFGHFVAGSDYDGLGQLLSDIDYLRGKQKKAVQYRFQSEFTSLLVNSDVADDDLIRVLLSIHVAVKTSGELCKEEVADWLDTFAYWLTEFGVKKTSGDRKSMLKAMSKRFDETCAEVSKALADKYEREAKLNTRNRKKGKYDYCMRFAELYTWVRQRSGDFDKCVEACEFAEALCGRVGMPVAYRDLGRAEFVRMRAYANNELAKSEKNRAEKARRKALSYEAYNDLNRKFSSNIWTPDIKEWEKLEGDKGTVLSPPSKKDTNKPRKGMKKRRFFKARVVSNAHDCIGAIHIIRFFMKKGGLVEWIHHKKFKSKQLASDDVLFTVLLGGPKAPEISDVAYEFYKYNKKNEKTYLRMYSGMYIESNRLYMKKDKTHCYMLGGISKLNTFVAAYEFTEDATVMKIIRKQPKS